MVLVILAFVKFKENWEIISDSMRVMVIKYVDLSAQFSGILLEYAILDEN